MVCTEIEDRNGNSMFLAYNAKGLVEKVKDATGREITFSYTKVDRDDHSKSSRLAKLEGPDNILVSFAYNDKGLLASVTQGNRTEYHAYRKEDNKVKAFPVANNADHNLVSITDANNHRTSYRYFAGGSIKPDTLKYVKHVDAYEFVERVTYPDQNAAYFRPDFTTANIRTVTEK